MTEINQENQAESTTTSPTTSSLAQAPSDATIASTKDAPLPPSREEEKGSVAQTAKASSTANGKSGKSGPKAQPKRSASDAKNVDLDIVRFNPGMLGCIKVTMDVPLGSDFGQNALETYLPLMEEAIPKLYDFVENRLRYGLRHIRSRELGNLIDRRMERSFSMSDQRAKLNHLEKSLEKAGLDYTPLFSQRSMTVSFSSPHSRIFIEGVQLQDRLVTLYQLAWIAGLVDTSQQREEFYRSTRIVGAAFNRVNAMLKTIARGANPLVNSGRRDGLSVDDIKSRAMAPDSHQDSTTDADAAVKDTSLTSSSA